MGIHRPHMDSPHKGPVIETACPCHDVIMLRSFFIPVHLILRARLHKSMATKLQLRASASWTKWYEIIWHDDVIKWKHFPHYSPICAGNSSVTGEFPAQRPVTRSFDVFFDRRLNKRLSALAMEILQSCTKPSIWWCSSITVYGVISIIWLNVNKQMCRDFYTSLNRTWMSTFRVCLHCLRWVRQRVFQTNGLEHQLDDYRLISPQNLKQILWYIVNYYFAKTLTHIIIIISPSKMPTFKTEPGSLVGRYYSDVKWASKHLNSSASRILFRSLFTLTSNETLKLRIADPLWWEFTGDRWIILTKGQ